MSRILSMFFLFTLLLSSTVFGEMAVVKVELTFDASKGQISGVETIFCRDNLNVRKKTGEIYVLKEPMCKSGFEIPISMAVDSNRRSIALLDQWLDTPAGLYDYELTITTPKDWVPVSEADRVVTKVSKDGMVVHRFIFDHPRRDITLVIGRYQVESSFEGGVEVATYFFDEHKGLAREYMEKAHAFIRDLSSRLGPFPFRRFAIVENEDPTGYGMATMTLIGTHILSYPFIVGQSLGHEIAHSWFGNGIYVDDKGGNWCEGLTTYVADYFFKEEEGKGPEYRHDLLIDYQSYVHSQNTLSLDRFRFRRNRVEKAVGYGKGAMVFHMLRRLLGDEAFFKGLRSFFEGYAFKEASWKDIRLVFERETGRDLGTFFNQWVKRADCPRLAIENPIVIRDGRGRYKVSFDVVEYNQTPYDLVIPYRVDTEKGGVNGTIETNENRKHIEMTTNEMPLSITLDPDLDLMRELSSGEFPPTISRLLGALEPFIVRCRPFERETVKTILGERVNFIHKDAKLRKILDSSSILFWGCIPEEVKGVIGNIFDIEDMQTVKGAVISVEANPLNEKEVVALLGYKSSDDALSLVSKLRHYGRYNYLVYADGKVVKKDKEPGQRGINVPLKIETMGIASKDLYSLSRIIDDVKDSDVIFVGEEHDQYAHHLAQLDVIKGLYERGVRLAVGMEMFQRPFQEALDKYIDGEITEGEFLRESEYFARWGYDYVLYRPILRFCREKKIPVVALNIRKEISRKVARHGLDALTEEEKALIPDELDFSNELYKRRLREVFEAHQEQSLGSFEYFYQAQVLWDETMAESVAKYLARHPGVKMVVLAGIGHIGFGYGIPSRVKRRTGRSVVTIASTTDVSDPGLADYFLFPPYKPKPFSARLGVLLDVAPGRPVTVKKVMPQSPASLAGIKAGDQILAFDGTPVKGIVDLKVGLITKGPDDNCTLTIKRNRRFLPDVTKTIKVGPLGARHGFMMMHGRFHGR